MGERNGKGSVVGSFVRWLVAWLAGWLVGDPMRSDGRDSLDGEGGDFAAHSDEVRIRQNRLRTVDVAVEDLRVLNDVFATVANRNDVIERRDLGSQNAAGQRTLVTLVFQQLHYVFDVDLAGRFGDGRFRFGTYRRLICGRWLAQ